MCHARSRLARLGALAGALGAALAMLVLAGSVLAADRGPRPPCDAGAIDPQPPYAPPGAPPRVETWHDVVLDARACIDLAQGPMELVVALSGRFRSSGGIEEIAERVGAISAMTGMRYWSVTNGAWRELVSQAHAVKDPDSPRRRADFSAADVLGGRELFFLQDDTRSSGMNLYSLTGRRIGPDGLAVAFVNRAPIRYLMLPLFDAGDLLSVQVVRRVGDDEWGYFGLYAVREGAGTGHEKSWINRAVAYQRLLVGAPTDAAPPRAP